MSAIVAAAAIGPQSKVLFEIKLATNTGRVFDSSPAIMTGIKNSFHESNAMKTPVAIDKVEVVKQFRGAPLLQSSVLLEKIDLENGNDGQ